MSMHRSPSTGFSRSTEDYLKAIYELETPEAPVQTSAIAGVLEVAPPSVTSMVKKLSESGLLQHLPYRGVQLTPAGRLAALRMVRRHRILETYLTSKLGYDWDSVHEEAERLEHAVSDELIERMAVALGYPEFDPHGAPIPTREGMIEELDLLPLSDMTVGSCGEFRMVSDRDPAQLRFLATLGLRPGTAFTVVGRQPFRGPVTVRFGGPGREREQIIGFELASALRCAALDEEVG
jgi:DtxR family Mn-dependent transcriptional regulator